MDRVVVGCRQQFGSIGRSCPDTVKRSAFGKVPGVLTDTNGRKVVFGTGSAGFVITMKATETTVKRMVVINAPQEAVWNTLVRRGLAVLHLLREDGYKAMQEGSTHVWYDAEDPQQEPRLKTTISVVAAPRRIALMAYVPSTGLPDLPENYTSVDIELATEEDGRTLVTVEQGDFAAYRHGKKLARDAGNGWVEALIRLREHVEHEAAA